MKNPQRDLPSLVALRCGCIPHGSRGVVDDVPGHSGGRAVDAAEGQQPVRAV